MKVTELSAPASLHRVRLGAVSYRVLRVPLVGRLVDRPVCLTTFLSAFGKPSIQRLAVAWAFAARSPRTIVYLPITRPSWGGDCLCMPEPENAPDLDLVLVHHSLQLRPSAWPAIRRRLGTGHPEKIRLGETAVQATVTVPSWNRTERFTHTVAGDTLVLAGSRDVFTADLDALRYLVEEAPAEHARHPKLTECTEIADGLLHTAFTVRPAPEPRAPSAAVAEA